MPRIAMSSPLRTRRPVPTLILRNGVFHSVITPLPRGYRMLNGPWSSADAVYMRLRSSSSFIGADTIMLGMHRM